MHAFFLIVLITVTGHGHASAAPNMATESFTIETNAGSAVAAASENARRDAALLQRLHALGVAASDIRTTSYNMYYAPPPPSGTQYEQRSGYSVSRTETVTIHDLNLAGKAIDAAIAAGVTNVGGVAFGVADTRSLLDRALGAAVTDARAQAGAMAQAAGLHITRVRSMQQGFFERPVPLPGPMMRGAMSAAVTPPTDIQPHDIEQTADVSVVYEAQ